ncbi:MAG: thiamine phosphate synthase [Magnetococcus sp. MYC-9]
MIPPLPRLLLITGRFPNVDLLQVVEQALAGGVRHLLLREKGLPLPELTALAMALRRLTMERGAWLLIHDHPELALAVGADGVHLSEQGPETGAVRHLLKPLVGGGLLGRSCHSVPAACHALAAGADYVTLSPLFPTLSHPGLPALGVERFAALRACIPGPVLALGGIHLANVDAALRAGADGVALIRGILENADPCQAAADLQVAMDRTGAKLY